MPCLQANSINWTPFYSMASKIDTSGSCPIGLCKNLMKRIAQVVGLALDALTLPIRLPLSCLCPGSLKDKAKELPKKEGVEEKKEVDSSSKEGHLEVKDPEEVVPPLEENKSEPSASSSSKLQENVQFLLGRGETHDILGEKQQQVAHFTTLAVEELLHVFQKSYYGAKNQDEEQQHHHGIQESFAKVRHLLNATKGIQNIESSSLEEVHSLPDADRPLSISDDDVESEIEGKEEISGKKIESAKEDSIPANEEKKEESELPPVAPKSEHHESHEILHLDPSLVHAPSNVSNDSNSAPVDEPVKEEVHHDESQVKAEGEELAHSEGKVAHVIHKFEGAAGKEAEKIEGALKHGAAKFAGAVAHTFSRKAEKVIEKELPKEEAVGNASHEKKEEIEELSHESSSSSLSEGSEGSDLSTPSSPEGKGSSGAVENEVHTPPTLLKDDGDIGSQLVELSVPLTPSPAKPKSQSERKVGEGSSTAQRLNFNQPLQSGTPPKQGKLSEVERKAAAKAKREAVAAAKKAEGLAKKEAIQELKKVV